MKEFLLVKKILTSERNNLSSFFSFIGQITGLALFSTLIFLLFAYNEAANSKDSAIGENYLIVNKKISLLNTLNLQKNSTFSNEQLSEINSCTGVEAVGGFQRNNFQATGSLLFNDAEINGFQTDLFMESVPNNFVEIGQPEWNWNEGQEIPIILPAEFLNLYNLNYAPSRGFPQISQSMLKLIRLQIKITGQNKTHLYIGKIVGFTHRIQSILVPEKFLLWANNNFGNPNRQIKDEPQRIIIKTNSKNPQELIEYLNTHQLETNQELLKSTKFYFLVISIFTSIFILGFIILFNSISSSLMHFKLQIEKLTYEIQTLKLLGFHESKLVQIFTLPMLIKNGFVLLIAYLFVYIGSTWTYQLFNSIQVELKSPLIRLGLISATIIQLIIIAISFSSIAKEIKKENS